MTTPPPGTHYTVEPCKDLPGVRLNGVYLTIREAQQLAVDLIAAILTPTQDHT